MGIICKKGTEFQFFHKSGQEYIAGAYLGTEINELNKYLSKIKTIKHALNLGMVLKFATSNPKAAELVVSKLVAIFHATAQCKKYYDADTDDGGQVESHSGLSHNESRTVQRLIELILECNYEGACRAACIKSVFQNGQILLTGLAQKTCITLAYFLSHGGECIRRINLHPIPHVNDSVNLEEGNMREYFSQIRKSMTTRKDDELKRICDRFQRANIDAWKTIDGLLYNADLASDSHDGNAYVAAYIQCAEESQGMPSLSEVNIRPIIDQLPKTNLHVLNCRQEYFGIGNNRNYLAQQIVRGTIDRKTLAVITELDVGDLTGVNIAPFMATSDFTRLMSCIAHMTALRYLDISRNRVDPGVTLKIFCTSVPNCTQLQHLNMGLMKGAESGDIESVFDSIKGLPLREIRIGQIPISSLAVRYLRQCRDLQGLGLYQTFIAPGEHWDDIWRELFAVIASLSKVQELYLHRNKFTRGQLEKLVEICRALKDLKKVW